MTWVYTRSWFKSGRWGFVQSLVFAQQEEILGKKVRSPDSEHSCWLAGWLWAVREASAPGVGGWGRLCGASEPRLSVIQPLGLCMGHFLSRGRDFWPMLPSRRPRLFLQILYQQSPPPWNAPRHKTTPTLPASKTSNHSLFCSTFYLGKSLCWKHLSV